MTERPILFNGAMVRALREGRKTVTRRTAGLAKINAEPDAWSLILSGSDDGTGGWHFLNSNNGEILLIRCPYGVAGDRLWTREKWGIYDKSESRCQIETIKTPRGPNGLMPGAEGYWLRRVIYAADGNPDPIHPWKMRPSIHMPRWASRDMLEVISARPERLHAITEEDAMAEGLIVQSGQGTGPGCGYKWNGHGYSGLGKGSFHVCNVNGICCCPIGKKLQVTPSICAIRELWDSTTKTLPWAKNPWVWRVACRRIEASA